MVFYIISTGTPREDLLLVVFALEYPPLTTEIHNPGRDHPRSGDTTRRIVFDIPDIDIVHASQVQCCGVHR